MSDEFPVYDRELLLLGAKRDAVLALCEVQRYGRDSYGDIDYVSVYGMRPADWYAKGARLLGRTAVECTRDRLADAIGNEVAAIAGPPPPGAGAQVVDLFAGSGNTLSWLLRHLPGSRGVGFEPDAAVFRLTRHNIIALALPINLLNTDYLTGLAGISVGLDELLILFIAPPWGDAFHRTSGVDLRRTTPPITKIVDFLLYRFSQNRLLCAIQIYRGKIMEFFSVPRAGHRRLSSLNMIEGESPALRNVSRPCAFTLMHAPGGIVGITLPILDMPHPGKLPGIRDRTGVSHDVVQFVIAFPCD